MPEHPRPDQAPHTAHTWFGPEAAPLFGALTLPADGTARGVVVVCPPIAQENVTTYRGIGLLCRKLAERGLVALRFDYYGVGDSAYAQTSDDAVALWLESIAEAVRFAGSLGLGQVSVVGVRLGALLAAEALTHLPPLTSLALWDPVLNGATYIREQKVLYGMAVGEDNLGAGEFAMIDAVLSERAVADLGQRSLGQFATDRTRTLLTTRAEQAPSRRLRETVGTFAAETVELRDQALFFHPAGVQFTVAPEATTTVADWVAATHGPDRAPYRLPVRHTALVRGPGGRLVRESIDYIGDHRLLAVLTSPAGSPPPTGSVLFSPTALGHRIGPARLWVELSRHLAEHGVPSARYDRRGTGDSGLPADDEQTPVFSRDSKRDTRDAAAWLEQRSQAAVYVGLCSGGWHSAYAARKDGADSVVLISPANWSRSGRLPRSARKSLAGRAAIDAPATGGDPAGSRLRRLTGTTRRTLRKLGASGPYRHWKALARTDYVQAPELLLRSLHRGGVDTTLILTPEDLDQFTRSRGPEGLARLAADGYRPDLRLLAYGDHALHDYRLRKQVANIVTDKVAGRFGLTVPPFAPAAGYPV